MLTTQQVRDILKAHNVDSCDIWTNKRVSEDGRGRTIKFYAFSNFDAVTQALVEQAGDENISFGEVPWQGAHSVRVKCVIA